MSLRIEDYALIGDCRGAALVGRDGSIDWLCWPSFDSAACFAALLGGAEQGRWLIAPAAAGVRVTRRYDEDTLVLRTRFETAEGILDLVDFMAIGEGAPHLVRLACGVKGRVTCRTELILRFDYGRTVPWVERLEDGRLGAIAGPDLVTLRTPVALRGENLTTVGEFAVAAGERIPFVLSYGRSYRPRPNSIEAEAALAATAASWREWARNCPAAGRWADAVKRSLIVLKGLTYAPTGAIVAAPTTSLPERIGGQRNWDYRFCWLRDATFTLLALMHGGYVDEARAWRDWLVRAIAGTPAQLQILYGLRGERRAEERELDLRGYENSRPVRIGNGAAEQVQLDVYGEVADALFQAREHGLAAAPRVFAIGEAFLEHLATVWREPDSGIWEMRGAPQQLTHSKVMAWVAFDRMVRTADPRQGPDLSARWRRLRDEIHAEVCARGFDAELGSFTQAFGTKALDASLLLLPIVGFLPPNDPRILGTVRAIEKKLLVDGLVRRYHTHESDDGLPAGEGAFLACSFWLADNYALQGRMAEAEALFERLLALRNDVGLLAEEYDPRGQRQLGNFPQAFSHVALVNTAFNLTRQGGPAERRSALG